MFAMMQMAKPAAPQKAVGGAQGPSAAPIVALINAMAQAQRKVATQVVAPAVVRGSKELEAVATTGQFTDRVVREAPLPEQPEPPGGDKGKGLSTGAIIGIAGGALAFIIIVALVLSKPSQTPASAYARRGR